VSAHDSRTSLGVSWAGATCPRPARSFVALALVAVLAGCAAVHQADEPAASDDDRPTPEAQTPSPFFEARSQEAVYAGPGRDTPPPEDLAEIRIGWFGPDDPQHPTAGAMWQAATLAVEEANRAGGLDGVPFRLLACWSENPWGSGVRDVTRLVYDDQVWAMVGAPDGPSAHLVEQITAKARLPFLSCASTDKTANLANVPWIFSLVPSDDAIARVLAPAIADQAGGADIVVVSATDHDSRMAVKELLVELKRRDVFPTHHLNIRPGAGDFSRQLETIRQADPGALALIAGPVDSARFVKALQQAGQTVPVFGGPNMARRHFADLAGRAAGGVRAPIMWDLENNDPRAKAFIIECVERTGDFPDYTAVYAYDAMSLLIEAISKAGLNRVRIRDAIRGLSGWEGVTGTITWDPTGQNTGAVTLGVVRKGRVLPAPCSSSHTRSRTR